VKRHGEKVTTMRIYEPDAELGWWRLFLKALRPNTTIAPGRYILGSTFIVCELQPDGSLLTCEDTPRLFVERP
jgi:hypothetical protein